MTNIHQVHDVEGFTLKNEFQVKLIIVNTNTQVNQYQLFILFGNCKNHGFQKSPNLEILKCQTFQRLKIILNIDSLIVFTSVLKMTSKVIGCIGKCTSGLTLEELDQITDNIYQTMRHPKGRDVFRKYLILSHRNDDLECVELYETCTKIMDKEEKYLKTAKEPTLESLKNDVNSAMALAEELDVPEIDLSIMLRFNEAVNSESREAMLNILHDTKLRLMEHLKNAHKGFTTYALKPCPNAKQT